MAGQRLTDKAALTQNLASGDLLMAVDVSDSTGSAEGTSKQIVNKYIIQTDKLSLDNTATKALNSAPQTLVTQPGSGYAITPLTVSIFFTYAALPELTGSNFYVGFSSGSTTNFWAKQNKPMNGVTTDATYILTGYYNTPNSGTHTTSTSNSKLMLYSDAAMLGGMSCDVYTTYQIIKL